MKRLMLLLFWPFTASAVAPNPIPLTEPTYAFTVVGNVQLNNIAPDLWIRFILKNATGNLYYCYKVNLTVPMNPTNGWVNALEYWRTGSWVPLNNNMSAEDINWCWQ